jgi:hypothetical protein
VQWLPYLAAAAADTPVGAAEGDLSNYILGWGPLGIAMVVTAVLLYKGWQLLSPARLAAVREEARADLLKENERLLAEKTELEHQLAEARGFERDQLVPLLGQFTAATGSLLPVLQEVVRDREGSRATDRRPRR